jgi:hypothetical protein
MGPTESRNLFPLTFAFVLIAAGVSAAQPPQATADTCLHRAIPLSVWYNPPHTPVALGQMQVLVNRSPVSPVSTTVHTAPVRVLLLIDTSGSMGRVGADSLSDAARLTASFAMDSVPLNATVAMGKFADRLQLSQWQDRESVRQQVLSLKYQPPKGRTALYSALEEALSLFAENRFADSVYLVTDGGENRSTIKSQRLVNDLLARGIRVFVFLVVAGEYKSPEEIEGPRNLEDLANLTGGLLYRPPLSKEWLSSSGVSTAITQFRQQVSSPYRVDFLLPSPFTKPAKLKLETSLDPKHFTLAYPRRIEPCSADLPHQP